MGLVELERKRDEGEEWGRDLVKEGKVKDRWERWVRINE